MVASPQVIAPTATAKILSNTVSSANPSLCNSGHSNCFRLCYPNCKNVPNGHYYGRHCSILPFHDKDLLRLHRLQGLQPTSLPWYGLLVTGLDELHTTFCMETDKPVARNWKTIAITTIWEHLHKAWQTITDQMHDKASSDSPFQQSLHHQARKLHQLSDRVPPRLRDTYFPEDINSWLIFSSPITISNWVKSYGKHIRRAVAQYEKHNSSMKLITAYFSRK